MTKPSRKDIMIAGSGGQGVIMAGTVLGTAAAVHGGKHAAQTSTYGTETRGSPSESTVVISDQRVGFPEVEKCDILVAMSQSGLNRNAKRLRQDALVIIEEDLVRNIPRHIMNLHKIAATRLSEQELRSRTFANMIMLGALVGLSDVVEPEACRAAIQEIVPPNTVRENLTAFDLGVKSRETGRLKSG